jgi:spore coat polysaccharide biosynthesis protein SpsF (cytidylyltransferase family)
MKIAIFITARMGSQRLSDKHFLKIKDNKLAINMLLDAIYTEFAFEISNNFILPVIVTGNIHRNKKFIELRSEYDIKIFFGDDQNIPLRHLQASMEYEIDSMMAIDGDDLMISREAMRAVYKNLLNGADYISTSGLPLGMNVMGYSSKVLREKTKDLNNGKLDTGWGYIFDTVSNKINVEFNVPNATAIRATLDYIEDLEFFKKVFNELNPIEINNSKDICDKIISKRLHLINSDLNERYWQNFESQRQENVE